MAGSYTPYGSFPAPVPPVRGLTLGSPWLPTNLTNSPPGSNSHKWPSATIVSHLFCPVHLAFNPGFSDLAEVGMNALSTCIPCEAATVSQPHFDDLDPVYMVWVLEGYELDKFVWEADLKWRDFAGTTPVVTATPPHRPLHPCLRLYLRAHPLPTSQLEPGGFHPCPTSQSPSGHSLEEMSPGF
jgi:hypothetical protein